MVATEKIESRLTDLENKLSYAEDLLDELNRTVFRQQEQIALLQAQLSRVYQQVREAGVAEASGQAEELPPHY